MHISHAFLTVDQPPSPYTWTYGHVTLDIGHRDV